VVRYQEVRMSSAAAHDHDRPLTDAEVFTLVCANTTPEQIAEEERIIAALRRGESPESLGLSDAQESLDQEMRRRGLR